MEVSFSKKESREFNDGERKPESETEEEVEIPLRANSSGKLE